MITRSIKASILILISVITCPAQEVRIDPAFWWVGMKNSTVQLCVHAPAIAQAQPFIKYSGVSIDAVTRTTNDNYLFLKLRIAPGTLAGKFRITFNTPRKAAPLTVEYELKKRDAGNGKTRQLGITSSDFIYLLMPDRFSNGDTLNDRVQGMHDSLINRGGLKSRHGGDLKGVMNHLDYIQSMGITALWMTPVVENNQPFESYHGYAFTDHYKVDPRLGSNQQYAELVNTAHKKGLKIIQDVVYNHIGNEHWFYKDMPSADWVHQYNTFTRTTYKDMAIFDPYASDTDRSIFSNGWFDKHMPDLNQKNNLLATYLIQNTIWWIEYAGVDGLRIDTWAYPDLDFENRLMEELQKEYPQLGLFGETWVQGIANQSYFVQNNYAGLAYKSKLPGVTDFQLYYATQDALNNEFGWESGSMRWYRMLANDYVYKDPMRNVLFLDNHDLSRFFSVIHEDLDKWKIGMAFLLTSRGIPSMYYGTELLNHNYASLSAVEVRDDFPGGWPGDSINKYEATGRTVRENEAFQYISKLAAFRKNSTALTRGKLMQYAPRDGEYVYFRYSATQTVMVLMNPTNKPLTIDPGRYSEQIQKKNFRSARNVMSGEILFLDAGEITLKPASVQILELSKKGLE